MAELNFIEEYANMVMNNFMPNLSRLAQESRENWPDIKEMEDIVANGMVNLQEIYEHVCKSVRVIGDAKSEDELRTAIQNYARDTNLLEDKIDEIGEFGVYIAMRRMAEQVTSK